MYRFVYNELNLGIQVSIFLNSSSVLKVFSDGTQLNLVSAELNLESVECGKVISEFNIRLFVIFNVNECGFLYPLWSHAIMWHSDFFFTH